MTQSNHSLTSRERWNCLQLKKPNVSLGETYIPYHSRCGRYLSLTTSQGIHCIMKLSPRLRNQVTYFFLRYSVLAVSSSLSFILPYLLITPYMNYCKSSAKKGDRDVNASLTRLRLAKESHSLFF